MTEYYDEEKPPSCAITCLGMVLAAIPLAALILIGAFAIMDDSNNILGLLVPALLAPVIAMPVAWWYAKRMKRWAQYNVSENGTSESGET
ncbi:MAG: hypothetical protein RTU92_04870 [Candidatus Thorarchaeota archaeon]